MGRNEESWIGTHQSGRRADRCFVQVKEIDISVTVATLALSKKTIVRECCLNYAFNEAYAWSGVQFAAKNGNIMEWLIWGNISAFFISLQEEPHDHLPGSLRPLEYNITLQPFIYNSDAYSAAPSKSSMNGHVKGHTYSVDIEYSAKIATKQDHFGRNASEYSFGGAVENWGLITYDEKFLVSHESWSIPNTRCSPLQSLPTKSPIRLK
ncbi:hypothetical protein CAPTEDRAFT_209109 [Capitella teleta]|uniref:Uncharacterized protein n=1 Tax=Capitella teleta TaxID=283909 RepID=R7UKI6_CAPTE|nr:hypothetical protein CAPTEDRAFT_209109 [Capitella teleta]|eukprot:ELU06735.1 hypothetical protein CAPTEDRAFT_209109 [Capitella teleta]